MTAFREANPEKVRAANAKYRAANRDKIKAIDAKYYASNRERIKARDASFYDANRERINARNRAYRVAKKTLEVIPAEFNIHAQRTWNCISPLEGGQAVLHRRQA